MQTASTAERPEGLLYREEFLSEAEEGGLLALLEDLQFEEVRFRGQVARRSVRHFGFGYDYETHAVAPTDPLPAFLAGLRNRSAELAGVEAERVVETLVTRYPPGATIGWHRDAPAFGSRVVGVSLLSSCRMRFQRRSNEQRLVFDLDLAPRSAYVLSGAARASWQHSIAPVPSLRYSITFRTLRAAAAAAGL